jgi:hypothetical protein
MEVLRRSILLVFYLLHLMGASPQNPSLAALEELELVILHDPEWHRENRLTPNQFGSAFACKCRDNGETAHQSVTSKRPDITSNQKSSQSRVSKVLYFVFNKLKGIMLTPKLSKPDQLP